MYGSEGRIRINDRYIISINIMSESKTSQQATDTSQRSCPCPPCRRNRSPHSLVLSLLFLYYYYHHHDIPLMPLPVAINGTIALQGPTRQGDAPQPLTKRAMIIRMSEETLEALAAYPAHPPLQFEFGDTPVCITRPASRFLVVV